MNKKLLALAISSAAIATSANAAEVYNQDGTQLDIGGRAEFRGDFMADGNGNDIDGTMGNASRFRLNMGMESEINDSLSGVGFFEAESSVPSSTTNDKNSDFNQRYMFAGLKGEFGTVTFGRQDTAAVQISQMSDITTYTGAQKTFISAGNEQINNTMLYTGEFDALTVKASYLAGTEADTDGYGMSAIYKLPMGLGFGLGYSQDGKATNGDEDVKGTATIAGINYSVGNLYLATTYTMGETGVAEDEEFSGIEMSAKYGFDNGFSIMGAYQNTEIDGTETYNKSDFYEITGDYRFNKNLNAYVSYMMNNLDEEDALMVGTVGTEDSIRLGLKYAF